MMIKQVLTTVFLLSTIPLWAQLKWDETESKNWSVAFKKVKITSSFDGSGQSSIVYTSSNTKPQPLIVSLHTWSGDYLQSDSIAGDISRRNWNYIHPNFRGPNNTNLACGSDAAIQDIDDAIQWALKNMRVDSNEVHIIGTSGGGYMTMLCYMKLKYPAKSFSSWVGISDLEAWYYESLGRGQKYADDILKCVGDSNGLNIPEARKRSPLHLPIPKRMANLHLYAGIHDGYKGSVPITQTMHFYNKVISAQKNFIWNAWVSQSEMMDLVVKRTSEKPYAYDLGNRKVHLHKQSGPVSLTIFEGGHEMIVSVAANLLPVYEKEVNKPLHVLAIGDSNGDLPGGWVHRLEKEVPWIKLVNAAKGGRTIGFDNNKDTSLNEKRLLEQHLQKANASMDGNIDWVVVSLGTNDAKADFAGMEEEAIANYKWLLDRLLSFNAEKQLNYRVLAILPPPIEGKADTEGKYLGANKRLLYLNQAFGKLLNERGIFTLDLFGTFSAYEHSFTTDGVHLNEKAQMQLSMDIQSIFFQ